MASDEATDLQPRLDLNLTTTRQKPLLEWRDAAGAHAVEILDRVTVGSSEQVAAVIADRAVSRLHAEITLEDGALWVRDLGSTNGTFVSGIRVQHAQIPLGTPLTLGNTSLVVSLRAQTRRVPLWPEDHYGRLFGASEVMREMFLRLSKYAATDSPVLVHGETGTGKELVAHAIHEASSRHEQPFVVVDCAALPETLLESELFGHARGSFTGATQGRAGAFEAASGGTVFIDEIGELPLSMQPKLLRVLESQTVRRIGEPDHRRIDVRFIAATHRDLQAMVAAGTFREDLYFRLAVLPVFVPPLRARRDDIPGLLAHLLADRPDVALPAELVPPLVRHPWVGNVRELRSFADRAAAIGPEAAWALTCGDETKMSVRPPPPPPRAPESATDLVLPPIPIDVPFKALRDRYDEHLERTYMSGMIEKLGRDVPTIARESGLDPTYVRRLLRKYDL